MLGAGKGAGVCWDHLRDVTVSEVVGSSVSDPAMSVMVTPEVSEGFGDE